MTTVIPPRSEGLIPAKLIDPFGSMSQAITEGQLCFSQLLVARTLVDIKSGTISLTVLNSTDQPQTIYRGTITAHCGRHRLRWWKGGTDEGSTKQESM